MDSNAAGAGRRSGGKVASLLLGAWASAVFVVLWVGAAIGLLGGAALPADAWAWLGGLPVAGQVLAWLLFLPVCIGLWTVEGGVPAPVAVLAWAGLVAWTAVAWGGFARVLAGRRRP